MNTDADILIRDYFNLKLDAIRISEYKKLYDEDADFRKLADQIEVEILGIRQTARKEIRTKFDQWETETEALPTKGTIWKLIGVAASLAFVLSAGLYLLGSQTNDELFYAYYESYPNYEYTTTRAESDDSSNIKSKAFAAYDAGEHETAIVLFTKLLDQNPNENPIRFFRAASMLKIGQYEKCIDEFKIVATSKDPFYTDDATWYLALIYVKTDKIGLAKTQLKKLDTSTDYQSRAQSLLDEL